MYFFSIYSQRSRHLFDVIRAVRVEDVTDLEHLEGLLDLALVPHDQPLDVVGVFAHALSLLQLCPDDGLACLVLLADVVVVDQPVSPLQSGQFWGCCN